MAFYVQEANKRRKATQQQRVDGSKRFDLWADADLDYEGFKNLAKNSDLSEFERIGFNNEDREHFTDSIFNEIVEKLSLDDRRGGAFLDIGCGAGRLTELLLEKCRALQIKPVLNDPAEMLSHAHSEVVFNRVFGSFPQTFDKILAVADTKFDAVLCYSVFHYIAQEHSPEVFRENLWPHF